MTELGGIPGGIKFQLLRKFIENPLSACSQCITHQNQCKKWQIAWSLLLMFMKMFLVMVPDWSIVLLGAWLFLGERGDICFLSASCNTMLLVYWKVKGVLTNTITSKYPPAGNSLLDWETNYITLLCNNCT